MQSLQHPGVASAGTISPDRKIQKSIEALSRDSFLTRSAFGDRGNRYLYDEINTVRQRLYTLGDKSNDLENSENLNVLGFNAVRTVEAIRRAILKDYTTLQGLVDAFPHECASVPGELRRGLKVFEFEMDVHVADICLMKEIANLALPPSMPIPSGLFSQALSMAKTVRRQRARVQQVYRKSEQGQQSSLSCGPLGETGASSMSSISDEQDWSDVKSDGESEHTLLEKDEDGDDKVTDAPVRAQDPLSFLDDAGSEISERDVVSLVFYWTVLDRFWGFHRDEFNQCQAEDIEDCAETAKSWAANTRAYSENDKTCLQDAKEHFEDAQRLFREAQKEFKNAREQWEASVNRLDATQTRIEIFHRPAEGPQNHTSTTQACRSDTEDNTENTPDSTVDVESQIKDPSEPSHGLVDAIAAILIAILLLAILFAGYMAAYERGNLGLLMLILFFVIVGMGCFSIWKEGKGKRGKERREGRDGVEE